MTYKHTIKIIKCDGAEESLDEALLNIPNPDRQQQYRSWLKVIFEKRSRGERLSTGTLVSEGDLPDKNKFYAMKKIPIRAYFWVSSSIKSTIFISHYRYKDSKKLDPKDTNRVCKNWKKYERGAK